MKSEFIQNVRDNLTHGGGSGDLALDRIKAKSLASKGKVDHYGDWSIFGQIFRKMKEKDFRPLRINGSSDKPWNTCFVGEGGYDAGGLFR